MTKEMLKELKEKFLEAKEKRKRISDEIKDNEKALKALAKKPDVIAYLSTNKYMEKLYLEMREIPKNFVDFVIEENLDSNEEEAYLWLCDYYNLDKVNKRGQNYATKVCRNDKKGTHRAYLGLESRNLIELEKEEAIDFEVEHNVVVLDEYDNPKDLGVSLYVFENYRQDHLTKMLKDVKVRKKNKNEKNRI